MLRDLRRFAVSRSLFPPTTLGDAVGRLGFVQADPIRAPARAQDLTLRHRVNGYRAGDLERGYAQLEIEEDVFINYGYVTRGRPGADAPAHRRGTAGRAAQGAGAGRCWRSSRERGEVHPREVDLRTFRTARSRTTGAARRNATTHLLESHALPRTGARRAPRARDPDLHRARARGRHPPAPPRGARRSMRWSTSSCASTRRCRARACRRSSAASATPSPQWRGELKGALQRALRAARPRARRGRRLVLAGGGALAA